jgi:CRP/FNR family transcriptional regulator, cyclic AMP receptor protein
MATRKTRQIFDAIAFHDKIGMRKSVNYGADDLVFSQGDPAADIFYIQKGKVKLTVISERGKEAVLAVLGTGDFFGEGCLNGPSRRLVTVTTMTDCTFTRVRKTAMIRLLHQEPEFSDMFVSFLLRRNARVEEDLVDHLFNSSEKRLARILLLLAKFGKADRPEPIIPNVNQETLAEMVGTTRSRVNTFMNKFRRLGFIEYNGGLMVRSSLLKIVLRD